MRTAALCSVWLCVRGFRCELCGLQSEADICAFGRAGSTQQQGRVEQGMAGYQAADVL
jgi:hypothetical protein